MVNKLKLYIVLLLSAALLLGFSACEFNSEVTDGTENPATEQSEPTASEEITSPTSKADAAEPTDTMNLPSTEIPLVLEIESVTASAGDRQVAVNISVRDNPGVATLLFDVEYDSRLVLTKVEYNSSWGGIAIPPPVENNPITLVWASSMIDYAQDDIFATLYFDVPDNAKGELLVKIVAEEDMAYNLAENILNFKLTDGMITVKR